MKTIEKQLMAEYEVQNHPFFFSMLDGVFSGVILRKYALRLLNSQSSTRLEKWVSLELMKKSFFAHSTLYVLQRSKALGKSNKVELTSSLVLRSSLRMEYFLSLGLDTPQKIVAYAQKGNNCSGTVNRPSADLLSRYEAALKGKGISVPDLTGPANEAALKRIAAREIFIDRISVKDNVLIPHMVYLNFKNNPSAKIAANIALATRELETVFFTGDQELAVRPVFTVCTFGEAESGQGVCREIYKKVNLPAYWGREDWLVCKNFSSPFPYLPPQNLL